MVDCTLLNLGSCLPEMFAQYILNIINAPLQPFLNLVNHLLSEPIRIDLFASLWAIIIYMLSMFYAFFIIYSGIQFMISGYDSAKREKAKEWLKNIVIMIVLVQASYFIYELAINLGATITTASLTLVDPNFFHLTFDSVTNIGLEIIFAGFYVLILLNTAFFLIVRYVIVSVGVVFFPIAIFCYFIEPLKPYGTLILNYLGIAIFIPFLDAIIIIGFSQLLNISILANFKILVMISAFACVDVVMVFLMFFSMLKAGFNVGSKIATIATRFA